MVNFNQLRVFYHTAKHQNCTVAAEKLFISQPAVTAQVKAFEDACNLKLFKKKGRKIYLTDEGKTLFEYAKKVFKYEKEIEDAIEDMTELKQGVLKLGTTKTYARSYIPLFISKFRLSYPGLKIHLREGSSLEMTNGLLDFQNEIAIVAKIEDNRQIRFIPFCQEEIVVILSPDHALAGNKSVTLSQLATEPIILKERGSGTRKALNEAFAGKGLVPNILMETNNSDFAKQLVLRGDGISFLVRTAVSTELEKEILVTLPIEDCRIVTGVHIAYLKDQHLSTPAQAFMKILEGISPDGAYSQSLSTLVAAMVLKSP